MADGDRQTHIERIYGVDENDSAWVDVEMLDKLFLNGVRGQKTVHTFIDNRADMADSRSYSTIRIENPEDDSQYVEMYVWDKYKSQSINNIVRSFVNDPDADTTRTIEVMKIVHRDIDDSFLDEDKQPPHDPLDYQNAIDDANSTDETQYVNMEVISKWQVIDSRDKTADYSESPQIIGQMTNNVPAIDNSTLLSNLEGDQSITPVRLDPTQWIVNVSWGSLAVKFGDGSSDAVPDKKKNGGK